MPLPVCGLSSDETLCASRPSQKRFNFAFVVCVVASGIAAAAFDAFIIEADAVQELDFPIRVSLIPILPSRISVYCTYAVAIAFLDRRESVTVAPRLGRVLLQLLDVVESASLLFAESVDPLGRFAALALDRDVGALDVAGERPFVEGVLDDDGRGDGVRVLLDAPALALVALRAAQVGRGGVEGALPRARRQLVPHRGPAAQQPQEALAELGRHQIVQNGVQRRVDVQHDPAEVQQRVVAVDAELQNRLRRHNYNPERERAERQQTNKETKNDGAEHKHHLLSIFEHVAAVAMGRNARIVHQVLGNHCVQNQ